jgi:hydrogenase-4 component F
VTDPFTLALAAVSVPLAVAGLLCVLPHRAAAPLALLGAIATASVAIAVAATGLSDLAYPYVNDWIALDAAAGLMIGVIGAVGLVSVLVSPAYLKSTMDSLRHRRHATTYYAVFFAFWAILLAVPMAGNLGVAWLLIEATTATSALLVGFSRKARALEAGWKYLILTSLGLGIALLAIALLAAGVPGGGLGALSWRALPTYEAGVHSALIVYVLLLGGLAAKIGWAPVHNWLPDAHSEAPAPVSAMLSAALLPAVLLVAWRCEQGLAPVIGQGAARGMLIAFGLLSVAVAVPFLARPLVWKRLLAYSSLEHMGVLALGIGFATPLALAGVAVHIVGHAIAKTLGFCAGTPLLAYEPRAAGHAVTGIGRSQPMLGTIIAISLGTLSGVPPSPVFISELLILAGGLQAGQVWITVVAAVLLALSFLALTRHGLELTVGDVPDQPRQTPPEGHRRPVGLRATTALAVVSVVLLLALTGVAIWLPTTDVALALAKGLL